MKQVFSGYIKNEQTLLDASSGGLASCLSEIFLENKAIIYGVAYAEDFKTARYVRIDDINSLNKIRGTKYVETCKKIEGVLVYKWVADDLKCGRTVLFFGLGCDVGAVHSFVRKNNINDEKLYLVDILCHGPLPSKVLEKYIDQLENRFQSKVTIFEMKKKVTGWTPPYVYAKFENGKEYQALFSETDLGIAFYKVARPPCTQCQFKGENHRGDLCIGDFWGITAKMEGWNPNGVSVMIVQTPKGNRLLEMIDNRFELRTADYEFVVAHNPMYVQSRKPVADYEKFMQDLEMRDLRYAVSKLPKEKQSIKQLIKKILNKAKCGLNIKKRSEEK